MLKKFRLPAFLVLALALGFGTAVAADFVWAGGHSEDPRGGRPLSAKLSGAAEVPGPGDPDGSGKAQIVLNQGRGEVCFKITVTDIADPTGAHIHVGEADVSGGVVVNFDVPLNGLSGCVEVEADLIKDIRRNPSGYYVNVHNADFPPGAIRGQLERS